MAKSRVSRQQPRLLSRLCCFPLFFIYLFLKEASQEIPCSLLDAESQYISLPFIQSGEAASFGDLGAGDMADLCSGKFKPAPVAVPPTFVARLSLSYFDLQIAQPHQNPMKLQNPRKRPKQVSIEVFGFLNRFSNQIIKVCWPMKRPFLAPIQAMRLV